MTQTPAEFFSQHPVQDVECLFADLTGIGRGKSLPAKAFAAGQDLRVARAICATTLNRDWLPELYADGDPDLRLVPVAGSLRPVPWASPPRALALHDCFDLDGKPTAFAPRNVLKRVLALYESRGWEPVVAPEIEFYLFALNPDPSQPFAAPMGRDGRSECGPNAYTLDALEGQGAFFTELASALQVLGVRTDTWLHEVGVSQFEINLVHGPALEVADQAFLFKRAVREVALRHGLLAVFMAKPIEGDEGSSMHVHQSVVDVHTRTNIFSAADGSATALFENFIAGQQAVLPQLLPMLCPTVNSFRRFSPHAESPANLQWGYDHRLAGLRVPPSVPQARRLETRLAGADTNPYLVMAATLAAGWHGLDQQLQASSPVPAGEAPATLDPALVYNLPEALSRMQGSALARQLLGEEFVRIFVGTKQMECEHFDRHITPWERQWLVGQV